MICLRAKNFPMWVALFAVVVVGLVIVALLLLLGSLMIFGSFFFERVPDLYLALKHLALFGGGVLSISVALAILCWALTNVEVDL